MLLLLLLLLLLRLLLLLLGTGRRGEAGMEVGEEREVIYLLLHCHHQDDS